MKSTWKQAPGQWTTQDSWAGSYLKTRGEWRHWRTRDRTHFSPKHWV